MPDPDEIITVEVHEEQESHSQRGRGRGRQRGRSRQRGGRERGGQQRHETFLDDRQQRAGTPFSPSPGRPPVGRSGKVGNPIPEGDPDPYDSTKKYCFIRNLDLKINGASPESFKSPGTRYESPMDFLNLQTTQGFMHTNQTNSIDPELFLRNGFIGSWNLSKLEYSVPKM